MPERATALDHARLDGRRHARRRRGLDRDRARDLRVLAQGLSRRGVFFGALSALSFGPGTRSGCLPSFYALPYVMTIVVLVLVSTGLA